MVVKAGDGKNVWPQFRQALGLKRPGLRLFSWGYNYGLPGEEAPILNALRAGSEGHIINAEVEVARLSQQKADAWVENLVEAVRQEFPDALLAHAPLPIIGNFPNFPYETFNRLGLAAMPQFYTKALGIGINYPLERLVRIWDEASWEVKPPAIYPILQGYDRQTAENLRAEGQECLRLFGGFSAWRWGTITEAMWRSLATLA